jgi:hypothetical protein
MVALPVETSYSAFGRQPQTHVSLAAGQMLAVAVAMLLTVAALTDVEVVDKAGVDTHNADATPLAHCGDHLVQHVGGVILKLEGLLQAQTQSQQHNNMIILSQRLLNCLEPLCSSNDKLHGLYDVAC